MSLRYYIFKLRIFRILLNRFDLEELRFFFLKICIFVSVTDAYVCIHIKQFAFKMNTHAYSTLLIVIIETPISIVSLNMTFTISNGIKKK